MESVKRKPFRWVSTIAYKEVEKIVSRGFNTTELVDKGYGLADMIFVNYQSRIPLLNESKMLDYVMVVNLDGGLDYGAAIARLIAKSDTYMTQAIGGSILAFGPGYGGFDRLGNSIDRYVHRVKDENLTYLEAARLFIDEYYGLMENKGRTTLGISNLDLKNPIPKRMLNKAKQLNVVGDNTKFIEALEKAAQEKTKEPVAIDMFGATCATMLDLKFTPEAIWTIIAIVRAYAAGAQAIEEVEAEPKSAFSSTLTPKDFYIGPDGKSIPSQEDRDRLVVANKSKVGDNTDSWLKDLLQKQDERATGWSIEEEIPYLKEMYSKK